MSDTDLTQYNGTASFPVTADIGTGADAFLVPTDGKLITALSNLINEAPVNRSLRRVKDLLLGLRGATIGDFAGAAMKTFNALHIDGVGGLGSTATANTMKVASGGSVTEVGPGGMDITSASPGLLTVRDFYLRFFNTLTSGANPPSTTALANILNALLIPKAFVRWEGDGVGGLLGTAGMLEGASMTSTTLPGASKVKMTFGTAFDNPYYVATSFVWNLGTNTQIAHVPTTTAASYMEITCGIDPAANQLSGMHLFFGRQTT